MNVGGTNWSIAGLTKGRARGDKPPGECDSKFDFRAM